MCCSISSKDATLKKNSEKQLIEWANRLSSIDVLRYESLVETPWSHVLRLITNEGLLYLKQTPTALFIEPAIMKLIHKIIPSINVPLVLFENPSLNCYIMESCGDYSLRTKFNGTIDPELLLKGLQSYIQIQRGLEDSCDALFKIGVPDWRIQKIPQRFIELIENKSLMEEEGVTPEALNKLQILVPKIEVLCETLAKQPIKETLVNCDFNENNLILDERKQIISVIDLGESVVSHPFFSIAAHLSNTARRYQLALNGDLLNAIQHEWTAAWLDVVNQAELETIYQHILKLLPVFDALSLYRLQKATNNQSKSMQKWMLKDSLYWLLGMKKDG